VRERSKHCDSADEGACNLLDLIFLIHHLSLIPLMGRFSSTTITFALSDPSADHHDIIEKR
jgi:hypothetical protein